MMRFLLKRDADVGIMDTVGHTTALCVLPAARACPAAAVDLLLREGVGETAKSSDDYHTPEGMLEPDSDYSADSDSDDEILQCSAKGVERVRQLLVRAMVEFRVSADMASETWYLDTCGEN